MDLLLENDLQAQHINKHRDAPNKPGECEKQMNIVSEVKGILKHKSETGNGNREVDNEAKMGINKKKSYKTYMKAF